MIMTIIIILLLNVRKYLSKALKNPVCTSIFAGYGRYFSSMVEKEVVEEGGGSLEMRTAAFALNDSFLFNSRASISLRASVEKEWRRSGRTEEGREIER